MSDVLERICATTKARVEAAGVDVREMRRRADSGPAVRDFAGALSSPYGVIAEIKKASPSAGVLVEDFDPTSLAQAYERSGARCLSVLTEGPHFQGSLADLEEARACVSLPVLRKDFMVTLWQIYESRAQGADCVLLIVAALEDGLGREMCALAQELGMGVLVEVHDERELERALTYGSGLVGVNNRNLKTLAVDLSVGARVLPLVPQGCVAVAESGLRSFEDFARMAEAGARAFLVGESLLRSKGAGMTDLVAQCAGL